jgi:hypothetical protein
MGFALSGNWFSGETPQLVYVSRLALYFLLLATSFVTLVRTPRSFWIGGNSSGKKLAGVLLLIALVTAALSIVQLGKIYWAFSLPFAVASGALLLASYDLQPLRTLTSNCLTAIVWLSLILYIVAPGMVSRRSTNVYMADQSRFIGIIGDGNILSFIAALLVLELLSRRPKRLLFKISGPIIVLALSQSALALAGLSIAVMFAIFEKMGRLSPAATSKVPRFLFLFSLALTFFQSTSTLTIEDVRGTDLLNSRKLIWDWSWHRITSSPLFGNSVDIFSPEIRSSLGVFWAHAHNQWLQDLVVGGVFRLAALILLLAAWGFILENQRCGSLRGVGILMLMIVECFGEVPFFLEGLNMRLFCLLAAIILSLAQAEESLKGGRVDSIRRASV